MATEEQKPFGTRQGLLTKVGLWTGAAVLVIAAVTVFALCACKSTG